MIYERLPLGQLAEPLDLPAYLRRHGLQVVMELSGWWQKRKFMIWTERADV
jgi:hypothetical protein